MTSAASRRALDYLEGLPGVTFSKLYQQPSTALAIFRRMLPHMAKTIVMAMLYMPGHIFATADLDAWIRPSVSSSRAKDRAMSVLQRLKILFDAKTEEDAPRTAYRLSSTFAKSLQNALTGGGNHRSFGVPCSTPDKTLISVDYLDSYARQHWEAILYYVVGSAGAGIRSNSIDIQANTKLVLQQGEFVAIHGGQASITKAGFFFLLQEINAQIWNLLIVYLQILERNTDMQMDSVDVLSFLFTLGSLELGTSYSTSNLTPTQQIMLEDLCDWGLIYRRNSQATRYYPTRLATTLTSDAPALPNSTLTSTTVNNAPENKPDSDSLAATANDKGYIILETNYRLYAYTSSPLLISILSLFARLDTRYPNMLTARLTKPSVQNAISLGIDSEQIINYLHIHAHPILRAQVPVLPPTVVDQIRLWQIEGERMEATRGFLIRDVGSREEFDKAVDYARALGVLVKVFPGKGKFFVERMDQMKTYFMRRTEERRARQAQLQA
ncbi:transcription factor Tfb2 [Polychaeton citri CBS 116435]|uniref:RNA polymerase II transcription factor B subunit 2 n=1 Tax=Polychaeton citri CBS 116435 TaxID=1314669 RepID=A0A9P4QHR6_9PEZI|nr:transcription factor Tfb2 [Polychaeton citri CBS 116435]